MGKKCVQRVHSIWKVLCTTSDIPQPLARHFQDRQLPTNYAHEVRRLFHSKKELIHPCNLAGLPTVSTTPIITTILLKRKRNNQLVTLGGMV